MNVKNYLIQLMKDMYLRIVWIRTIIPKLECYYHMVSNILREDIQQDRMKSRSTC